MNIETDPLYTCNETCEMNVSVVCAASQNPKIVSIRPAATKGSRAMFATEERWCGVVTTNKRRISTSRERTVARDILTEKHRPRKPIGSVVFDRSKIMCTQLRMREQRAVQKTLATIQECASDGPRS